MPPLIIAHRGASADAPENTLEAFRLAWSQGADAIEMDLRLTQDSRIAVLHDEDLYRVSGDVRRIDKVNAAELADIRVRLRAGDDDKAADAEAGADGSAEGHRVPLLEEVLREMPPGKGVFLECKAGREMLPLLRETLWDSPVSPEQVVVIGFDMGVMIEAKRQMPDLSVGWVLQHGALWPFPMVVKIAQQCGLSALALREDWQVTPECRKIADSAGLALHFWTVNDTRRAVELSQLEADGLITNHPRLMREAVIR